MSLSRWLSILCWRQCHMMRSGLLQNLKNHHSKLSTKIHWVLRISSILMMMPWWCRRSFKFDGSAQVLIVDFESVVSLFCTGVAVTQGHPDIIPFPDVIWIFSGCYLYVLQTLSVHSLDVIRMFLQTSFLHSPEVIWTLLWLQKRQDWTLNCCWKARRT